MHISEGVLRPEILIGGAVISLAFTAYGLKKLKNEEIPLVAVFSALFFLASFVHVPIGPTSIHLILSGIIGAVLGIRAFIAIFIALLLQGLFFGFGGVSTLGINTLNLALPSLLGWLIIGLHVKRGWLKKLQYFLVGFMPVCVSALFLATTLALNGDSFVSVAKLALVAYVPVMFIEGIITLFALAFLDKVYPKLLKSLR